ncbi:hypothetical protein [Nocardia iowensis]|uniref:Uncharacterized protein n=1 Tax=Nocardia iowensis TaxID=204891 RepID=A0ABX8RIH7_NOCIO|nr:hypothetical protein [Nocardia iowensis]QXN89398.1 hypothetical protein KV110_28280 [Nocardia iowensis]
MSIETHTPIAARTHIPLPVRPGRPRVLVAPVTITPTKPLTPSHLKGLLWTDVLYRATTLIADADYRYSPTAYHVTEQTLGFWEFLDRTCGDVDYASMSEVEIGELYVRYRATPDRPAPAALRPYETAVEESGWVHPASARLLARWRAQYARLGMHDPGLTEHQPPGLSLEAMIDRLGASGLCLDMRADGGPVYADPTRFGMPLRRIVGRDGRPNYLACALRELLPLVGGYDEVVLLCDTELEADYQLLQRILENFGPKVRRVTIGRVPIDGHIRSARSGDWHEVHLGALLDRVGAGHDSEEVSLGVRLYFIATLGPSSSQSFDWQRLTGCLDRARRLLAGGRDEDRATSAEFVAEHLATRGNAAYVDPYRLTSRLLARYRPAARRSLLQEVYL